MTHKQYETIMQILETNNKSVRERNGISVIYDADKRPNPEDYISIVEDRLGFTVYENHRSDKTQKHQTREHDKAIFYAVLQDLFMGERRSWKDRQEITDKMDALMAEEKWDEVRQMFSVFSQDIYSFDGETDDRFYIAEVEKDSFNVFYDNHPIVKNYDIQSAHHVLYNYCYGYQRMIDLTEQNAEIMEKLAIDREEVRQIYLERMLR